MNETIDYSKMSSEDLAQLLERKRQEESEAKLKRREAYEGIRAEVVQKIENKVRAVASDVLGLFAFVTEETEAMREIMAEYGQLTRPGQMSYTLKEGNFKIEVKSNKVKRFDERADVAAARLIEFLQSWINRSEKGTNDPMYQLGMTLLERNKYGDLDYKSISKLYDLEERFNDPDYSAIMDLFKESNIVEATATNFYFWEKSDMGVWKKIEPSFNRL